MPSKLKSTSLIRLVFIRVFLLIEYAALTKSLTIEESLVLDLKILMYRNVDEIEKLKKIKAFERYVSTTTHQYVGHVLVLVKSYWPTTRLDALGKGAKADCTDEQFCQYMKEASVVANQIVESLNKPDSP